ncbi:hypothetical protein BP6252_04924 [Coleophoma cylindrospora]|uniref:Major facilitator superfamily (MFS) profile domain-containing protein n=1 Tax=Coleophoma cylindrospora TaxID=1849047 RepID=A0A3D8S201_9HELO|nr:hypothetical protein BP6252_04924 [Coleophoma cylindrospora]
MGTSNGASATNAVGAELAAVLPSNRIPWWKRGNLLRLNFTIFSLCLLSSAGGYDGSMMNGLLALPQWYVFMDNPTGSWLGFINAVYWLGMGISFPIAAPLSNKYGRKLGIYIGYVILVLGTILQTAAHNSITFILGRFFLGVAGAWYGSNVPLLISEIAYPTHRGIASSLYNCGWYIGSLIAAWATFGTRNFGDSWCWRIPSVLQALLPLVALPGLLLTPESPRWLVSVDRQEEALKILTACHAGHDADSMALVNFEIVEIESTIASEKAAHESTSYMDMIKTKGNRRRLLISITLGVFGQWVGNGVVSYYLALVLKTVGITSVTNQLLISAALQIWNLIFAVVAAMCVDKLGRRTLFLGSASIMLVAFIIVTGLSGSFAATGHAATGTTVIPFLFIFFAGYDIALTPLLVSYPCEIWPYRLRSRGLTVMWVTTIVAIFFNTFINPIALQAIGWKYYFVFVAVCATYGIVAFFFYPETRGHSLEQMAIIFDGDDAELISPTETAQAAAALGIKDSEKVASGVTHIE